MREREGVTIMGNQMENKMADDMETEFYKGL